MNKALNKSEAIKKAAEAYKNDPNLSFRRAAAIHDVAPNSIRNYLNGQTKPTFDCFVSYQKLSLIEESVLVEYIMRGYYLGYPLTIPYLNDCVNELLQMKDVNDIVGYY